MRWAGGATKVVNDRQLATGMGHGAWGNWQLKTKASPGVIVAIWGVAWAYVQRGHKKVEAQLTRCCRVTPIAGPAASWLGHSLNWTGLDRGSGGQRLALALWVCLFGAGLW